MAIGGVCRWLPYLQGGRDARYNFYPQAYFLLNPARFLLNPSLTELAAVATDDGAPVDDGSPKGAVLALTAANSAPGECPLETTHCQVVLHFADVTPCDSLLSCT